MFNLIFTLIMALFAGCSTNPNAAQGAATPPAAGGATASAPASSRQAAPAAKTTTVSSPSKKLFMSTSGSSTPAASDARGEDDSEQEIDLDLTELAELEGLEGLVDAKTMEAVRTAFRAAQGAIERSKPALRWAMAAGDSPQFTRMRLEGVEFEENAPFLGVSTEPVGAQTAAQLPIARGSGLVVTTVEKDSPAAAAGLQPLDVITLMGDQILVNMEQLAVLIRSRKPGDAVTFTYLRGGKQATATATLGSRRLPKLGAGGRRMDGGLFSADDDVLIVSPEGQHARIMLAQMERERQGAAAGGAVTVRGVPAHADAPAAEVRDDVSMRYSTDDALISYSTSGGTIQMSVKDVTENRVVFEADRVPSKDEIASWRPEVRTAVERMLKDVQSGSVKQRIRMRTPDGRAPRAMPVPPVPPVPPVAPSKPAPPAVQAPANTALAPALREELARSAARASLRGV